MVESIVIGATVETIDSRTSNVEWIVIGATVDKIDSRTLTVESIVTNTVEPIDNVVDCHMIQ